MRCGRSVADPPDDPVVVEAAGEVAEGPAKLLDGVEGPEPQELALERSDEPFDASVPFGLPQDGRARLDADGLELVLEGVRTRRLERPPRRDPLPRHHAHQHRADRQAAAHAPRLQPPGRGRRDARASTVGLKRGRPFRLSADAKGSPCGRVVAEVARSRVCGEIARVASKRWANGGFAAPLSRAL